MREGQRGKDGEERTDFLNGEMAQWLGHRIADRKVSSSSPALPMTVLKMRDISNLSSHTVHSAECTGNCT